jgi:hypothetical protein
MIREPEKFFGRRKELAEIFDRLRQMQSVSVVGEWRIGKSSLLYHIYQTGKKQLGDFDIFYLDMRRVRTSREFFQRVVEMLGGEGDDHLAMERALRNRKVVLCLDEFEMAADNEAFPTDFFDVLHSFVRTGELALVVATRHPLPELPFEGSVRTSPFFSIFLPLRLGPFTEEEARELVATPAQRAGQPFTEEEIAFALELGERYPWKLQVACFHLFEAKQTGQVDFDAVRRECEGEFKALQRPERPPAPPAAPSYRLTKAAGVLTTLAALTGLLSVLTSNPAGLFIMMGLAFIAFIIFACWLISLLRGLP